MTRLQVNNDAGIKIDDEPSNLIDDQERSDTRVDSIRHLRRETDASQIPQLLQLGRERLLSSADLKSVQSASVSFLQQHCTPVMLAWYYPAGTQIGQTDRVEGLLCPTEGISASLKDALRKAAQECTRRRQICSDSVSTQLMLFSLPVPAFAGHSLLMVADIGDEATADQEVAGITKSMLLLSSFISEWGLLRAGVQNEENAKTVAAMIELVAHVHSADDANAACQRLVDSLHKHLMADRVAVGLCRSGVSDVKLTAMSGGSVIDPYSEETRLVESVLQESLIRSTSGVWPVLDHANRHALLSHQQLCESGFGGTLVSMPIRTESGSPVGSLLVTLPANEPGTAIRERAREAERFLRAGAGAFAGCLNILQKLADSRWLRMIRGTRSMLSTSRLQMASWIAGAVAMFLLFPVTYRVQCALELQPVQRNYVAAPFDGPLEECLVEPGDVVSKDQLLALMDGREIRWELAEVEAKLNKATKERNTQLSRKEFGNAAISGHEMQRLEQRAALLNHRSESLEIRSPADGVVVSGDHREAEGVPLEMGKTLFEIAPLDAMVVELCIPEEDVRHVFTGMTVDVQLEAVPEESITAVIRSVHPRAELHDGKNVFIAEADIPNKDALFRPGMRGTAHVNTQRHALGWNLFHKPTAWLLGWLGW